MKDQAADPGKRSEFAESLRRGLLIGAAALVLILPPALYYAPHHSRPAATAQPPQATRPQPHIVRHAEFGTEAASDDVHRIADWVADSHDNGTRSFVVLDKRNVKVFLFDKNAHLQAAAPTVIGEAVGDDSYPGVGDKPLNELKPYELTTPAGRFIAEPGETSSRHEDVVWVDYNAAVSMHRVIKVPKRLQALANPTPQGNRLSHGCINVPDAFYEKALRPAVDRDGVVVYILPETRPIRQTFASFYDVDTPVAAQSRTVTVTKAALP